MAAGVLEYLALPRPGLVAAPVASLSSAPLAGRASGARIPKFEGLSVTSRCSRSRKWSAAAVSGWRVVVRTRRRAAVVSEAQETAVQQMAGEKSKVLIIGGTGYIGKFVAAASARLGNPTFMLVRNPAPSDPAKAQLLEGFKNSGVTLIKGDLSDHESLVNAMKQVDVVISTIGHQQAQEEPKILEAIKEAGNIKRYYPSEFGNDVDHGNPIGPTKMLTEIKSQYRRTVEASGVPYTIVSNNFFAGFFLPNLAQADAAGLPTDKVTILGNGNVKAIFVAEDDVGTYTIKSVDDPRTLNKILYIRPPANTLTHNEIISLWEKKVGKTFERVYVPEKEVEKQIEESPMPLKLMLALLYTAFVKGDHTSFEIEPSFGVEATQLYPDVKYTTIDQYLNRYL